MNNEEFQLIDGTYAPEDAHEMLMTLLSDKIKFHSLHIHSTKERFNGDTQHSEKRMVALKKIKDQVSVAIEQAKAQNMQLTISGIVNISFTDKA